MYVIIIYDKRRSHAPASPHFEIPQNYIGDSDLPSGDAGGVRARCALANPVPVTLDKTVNLRDSAFGLADAQSMVDLNVALQSRRKPWENGFVSVLSG